MIKQLLSIIAYNVSGDDIGQIKKLNQTNNYAYNILPEFCLRTDNGYIDITKYYLQFVDSGDENYILFNISHIDAFLSEEISNTGIDEVFKDIDFRLLFEKIPTHRAEYIGRALLSETHIVIGIDGNEDYMNFFVLGYLDNDMKFVEIK